MKRIILLSLSILLFIKTDAQSVFNKENIDPVYLKFLPSDADPNNLRPSDIPSEQVLTQMGLSESEIIELMNFKYKRDKYVEEDNDTTQGDLNLSKLYDFFGDTIKLDSIIYPKGRIYGQSTFRNNELSFFQKSLDAKAPENYKVGTGDEISIAVWGYSEFSETLMVDERGYITPSSYGRIYVKGLTFKKMRSLLKSRFSSFLDMKNSEIDVTLSYSRVITVNIVGEVYNAGSYSIPAINTAFNALIAAKGPSQLGTVRNIYIKRDGKTIDSLDVYQFLFNPKRSQDIFMQDGDYLLVPPAKHVVEVKGAVNRPYTYEIKEGESVADVIRYAGGYTTNAFTDLITLKRINYNAIQVKDVNKSDLTSTLLKNGDELVINTISNRISNVVSIKGSIGVSGDYEFVQGERLLGLLTRAKCIDEKTFLEKVYLIRTNEDRTKSHITVNLDNILNNHSSEDNILLQEYDVIRVLSIDDFDDYFFVSVDGAVRSPGKLDFADGITLQDVLLQSGGFSQKAEQSRVEISRIMDYDKTLNKLTPKRTIVKRINIKENLVISNDAAEFRLKPFDQVFVRDNPAFEDAKNIILTGEVKYPGSYTLLSKDEKISSIIQRAGGLTNYAYLDGVKMFRKFVVAQEENLTISEELKKMIIENPDLVNSYTESLIDSEKNKKNIFGNKDEDYAYDGVYLNLKKALDSRSSKHNIVLVEGDSIIVPKTMDVVHITGALKNLQGNSISAPHFSRKRANYYVNNFAGGFTKENRRSNTVVIYPNGIAKKTSDFGLFTISPRIKKGSTIIVADKVKKKKKQKEGAVDWNRQIENAMLKVTAVLTLWLLVDKVNAE